MEEQHLDDLLNNLEMQGVELDRPEIETEAMNDASLYSNLAVKILSIFGGMIGSIFLVLFLLLLGLYDSPVGLFLLGLTLFISAIAMSKIDTSVFLDTINIAMWLVGIGMIGAGLMYLDFSDNFGAIIMILLGTITFIFNERFLLRFLSVLLISISMVVFIFENEWFNLTQIILIGVVIKMTYLHLYESELISENKFFNSSYPPLRLGLIFSLIGLLFLVGKGGRMNGLEFDFIWISSLVIIGANLFSINKIMEGLEIDQRKKMLVLTLASIIFLPSIFSPFISGAILILILNYHIGYRTGIAIGIITLIYSISQYYYDLNWTLLQKSGVLVLSGIFFLSAYFIFTKNIAKHETN